MPRIQTWFPFAIQVCLNGREWLARQMDHVGLRYVRRDNCFPWVAGWGRAQRLLAAQRRMPWPHRLDRIARALNPVHGEMFRTFPVRYYWMTYVQPVTPYTQSVEDRPGELPGLLR
jgi:hypothetical protein